MGSTTQFHRYWISLRPTQILVNHVTFFLLKNFSDIIRLEICRKYLNIGNFRWFVCFNTRPDYCRHCRQLDARLLVSGQALQHFMLFHPLVQKTKSQLLVLIYIHDFHSYFQCYIDWVNKHQGFTSHFRRYWISNRPTQVSNSY